VFGARPLYVWRDALAWAENRLTEPRHSTSEHDARKIERRLAEAGDAPSSSAAAIPPRRRKIDAK
jgi:hypothetical protein